ncbi:helix-turn-helix domain-containing protein [Streptomyces sp. NPDC102364]|uniref:helix-turn-helix domain-containing protein n=1 Tax=Streptomyces sp. NPDC102364 TaxID=3366161 RepID=UPI003811F327
MAYGRKTPHQARQRAAVVLLAARGRGNARIAAETHLHVDTVRTWRGRFALGGLPALADRKRSGRPARFTPAQVAEAKALACQLPLESGIPLSRWSCPELAAELTARGITATVSASTVRRWLREDALKPRQRAYALVVRVLDPGGRDAGGGGRTPPAAAGSSRTRTTARPWVPCARTPTSWWWSSTSPPRSWATRRRAGTATGRG